MGTSNHIWEGWTVEDFIESLQPQLDLIMGGKSWRKPLRTWTELESWCGDNQPYYKQPIPEVVGRLAARYGIRKQENGNGKEN